MKLHFRKKDNSKEDFAPDRDIIKIIIFACVIIVLSIVSMGSIAYTITRDQVVYKLKNEDLSNVAELISNKIDNRIETAKEISLVLAKDPQIIQWVASGEKDSLQKEYALKKISALATDFNYTSSFIVSAVTNHYWDENGQIIDTMDRNDPDDKWFFSTISREESVTVQFDYNPERKGTYVFINALMGDAKSPIAITGVGLGLSDLSQEMQKLKREKESYLWLIDKQGQIYLSSNQGHSGDNIKSFIPPEIKRKITNVVGDEKSHTFEYENNSQELMDLIAYPLESTQQWTLLFQIPRSKSISFLNSIKLNTLFASVIILVSFLFFFYFVSNKLVNPYKKAMELNRQLEDKVSERTREVHEKNAKLLDSIDYAQRIQEAILPSHEILGNTLKEHFLIWQPRDIVGGDFYWMKETHSGCFIVLGDCTGHGVPGALMSMISVSILNQIVIDDEVRPSKVLKKLNGLIKQILKQEEGNSLTNDGLDIGVCYFDRENTLTYAGAKLSLYVRSNEGLRIVEGDKKSIGYATAGVDYSFADTVINIKSNDVFYMTTDGYTDQNGGPKDFSFGKIKFVDLINTFYSTPLVEQRELFLKALLDYMGEESQRDDISVIAFKIK